MSNKAAKQASPAGAKRKLTRAEKKEIAAIIGRTKGDGKPHTAQQTIPYVQMYPDGICKVSEKKYSKSIVFEDINYQLAQADDKTAIFENWCDFLNYFDASVSVQLSFINQGARKEKAQAAIQIPQQDDAFNSIRAEYADMLKNQLEKGNNGLEKAKYITFSIEADNLTAAKARLSRIETDVLNNFKVLGVAAHPMTGYERLQTLHGIFHPEGEPFRFSWDWLAPSGLTTKDFIAPSSFRFGDGRMFRMGKKLGAVSFLEILAPELNDRMLADILDLENGIIVNLHIKSIDQTEAIKTIKRKITDLDKMKIEEQKKAVRSGYDMDIIPSDLATFGSEAKNLLQDLQSRNERMFLLTFLVVNMADTKRKLENDVFATAGIAQKNNCALTRLDYMQEAGFMSSIPLGDNLIPIQRGLTTSSTAIFIPFITQELFHKGAALYYGLNALSNNMILCDRKKLKNPNGLILGTPGSGKSFAAKREIINIFLITDDDIIICDPEAEYYPLVERLHGQVIRISPTSSDYINPMDINLNYSEDDNPLALKSDFILSLCELVIGGKEGLQPVEKTVIDRAVRNVYRTFLVNPDPANMPILGDLYEELLKQPEPEAARVAAALELYVSGSLNIFNHRTNVELSNRLICFDIKQLGKQLKKLGMLIVQDQVWNRVTVNRAEKKATRYYMDEFHLLLKEEQTAAYSVEIWKRFRKWGGIPTAITQNVKDLLSSREVENIFENSDFVLMLNQAAGDRAILAKQLNISPQQMKYVTHTDAGEGLIFYGNVVLPFVDRFPTDTELYRVMTTKPEEVSAV
ncbi:MAG: ATP-binding protein [Parabacteroides sp.]|nr:ATP-binding protein [Parabacteroides sp.]